MRKPELRVHQQQRRMGGLIHRLLTAATLEVTPVDVSLCTISTARISWVVFRAPGNS